LRTARASGGCRRKAIVSASPTRVLLVFDWLFISAEETEARLLARGLPADAYELEAVACYRNPRPTHVGDDMAAAAGLCVDTNCHRLDDAGRAAYLAEKIAGGGYDVVVGFQGNRLVHQAYERLPEDARPPLVEHGSLSRHVFVGIPKTFTSCFVAASRTVYDTAAMVMPPQLVRFIPSMVDVTAFRGHDRAQVRRELGAAEDDVVVGWVGRLDHHNHADALLDAAERAAADPVIAGSDEAADATDAAKAADAPLRFVIVGAEDPMAPEFAARLRERLLGSPIRDRVTLLTDRRDVPRLMTGFDALVWLATSESMPHVIAEAGAAGVAVIAARDAAGGPEQIEDNLTGLIVDGADRGALAAAMRRLAGDAALRGRLGSGLHDRVAARYDLSVVLPEWRALFDELAEEARRGRQPETAVESEDVAAPVH
jgi:glycosyltransferase involved in cell wall biosynthesis